MLYRKRCHLHRYELTPLWGSRTASREDPINAER